MKILTTSTIIALLFISQLSAQGIFKVTTDKSCYSYGDTIKVSATLTNNTGTSFSLYGSSTCFMTVWFDSIPCFSNCTTDYNDFSMPPGSSRTWLWTLVPARLGIPGKSGNHVIHCYINGRTDLIDVSQFRMEDSTIIQAPKYYGGQIYLHIKKNIPQADIKRLRDSLNATVLNSYCNLDSTTDEYWQVVNHSIDSAVAYYLNDYRLIGIGMLSSNLMHFEDNNITRPEAPKVISPAGGSMNQPAKLKFSWMRSPGAISYRLQVSTDSLFSSFTCNDSTLQFTTHEIDGLSKGMKYYWRISACNYTGSSKFSLVSSFTTMLPSPDSLTVVNQGFRCIRLSWINKTDNESGFIIERKTIDEQSYKILDTLKPNFSNYTDSTILPSVTYLYRIKSFTHFASSEYSNIAAVTTLTTVDKIREIPTEFALMQNYPNPFNPTTVIKYAIPVKSYVILRVFSLLGSEVSVLVNKEQSAGEYEVEFNCNSLPSGIYIYSISAGDYRASKKLMLLK